MNKYKVLLIDLDDTILSFSKAEAYSIKKVCEYYNIEVNDEIIKLYKDINLKYWHMLERKEITREKLLEERFKEFFKMINCEAENTDKANDIYFSFLTSVVFYIDGSVNALKKLKEKYKIYLITNGVKMVQEKRLSLASDVACLLDGKYVSETIGYPKPTKEYMDYVLDDLKIDKKELLIIGDSVTSDMMLGINNGIDTCWFNEEYKKTDANITYEVHNYDDILRLLMNES